MLARRSRIPLQITIVVIVVAACSAAQSTQAGSTPVYLDPNQPISERVNDLLDKMTLEEKASQLVNQGRAIPRLQIPAYDLGSGALRGVANAGTATVFPEPIGLAATFDDSLIHDAATAIGTEARAKRNQAVKAGRPGTIDGLDFWAPNLNIFRDPRWGRGQETYGEDPYLTSRMGVAFVIGLQGDDPNYLRVIATPKYFAEHSGPESVRHAMNAEASKHDMEDTYLPAFRAAMVEGKAASVMCADNSVNGEPACANTFLLQRQLRHSWKFTGYVVSDCDAVVDMVEGHHFAKSRTEAVADALKAGMDNECADYDSPAKDNLDYAPFLDAVKQGLLSQLDIDRAIEHLFTARLRLGMFDPPEKVPYARIPESEIDSAAHRELALKAAKESMVLLKNDGILPLATKTTSAKGTAPRAKRILVTGPLADSTEELHGSDSGAASHAVSALEGIRRQFGATLVSYASGAQSAEAVAAARRADVVVAIVGIRSRVEDSGMKGDVPGFNAGDRASLDLPQLEQALLEALKGTGKPLIVVLMNGGALSVNWANENANAILEAWYAGEEGGTAIAQTLAGTNNPAGRLPVTFYKSVDQLPAFDDYSMSQRTYRYFEGEPLYPFGYGLSYSTFEYSNLKVPVPEMKGRDPLTVEVDVKNTSQRAGDEVAQLYLTFPRRPGAPLRALRGFTRVHLEAGEQKHLTFTLQSRDLSHVDDWGDRLVGQGSYVVTVGGGQPGTNAPKAEAHFTVRGEAVLPE
jgi:beta-glucosidase